MAKEDNIKPRVLFIYDHRYPDLWRDGLWAALEALKEDFEISKYNLFENNYHLAIDSEKCDFILGWGAFGSPVDEVMTSMKNSDTLIYKHPMGLCLAGNASTIPTVNIYDIIFYETNWAKDNYLVNVNGKKQHAFGINTNIFNPWKGAPIIWDWLSVGSFAYWKRHIKIMDKPGTRLVIGEIQRNNWQESFDIISDLLLSGVGVSDMLYPTKLRNIYNCAGTVYIPADLNGGGERAVLEARACEREVLVEKDNPKLEELVSSPVYDEQYYAEQLKKGILECLEK